MVKNKTTTNNMAQITRKFWEPMSKLMSTHSVYKMFNNCKNEEEPCLYLSLYREFLLLITRMHNFYVDATCLLTQLPRWLSGKESACQLGDADSIPGSGRYRGEGDTIHSSILAWKIPWIGGSGGLQSMGLQELDMTWWLNNYLHSQGVPEKVLKMYYIVETQW